MSLDKNWDVSKYRSPHEPNYQWELKKKFMELNKDRFCQDRLVCLAQTFANIEFLGCRYPKPVMELIEELSYGVVHEYREQTKGRLKRTFVSGSDAAGAKVNRVQKRKSDTQSDRIDVSNLKYGRFVSAENSASNDEKSQPDQQSFPPTSSTQPAPSDRAGVSQPISNTPMTHAETSTKRARIVWDLDGGEKKPHAQQRLFTKKGQQAGRRYANGSFSNLLLMRLGYNLEEPPEHVLSRSAGLCRQPYKIDLTRQSDGQINCDVSVSNRKVATATGQSLKEAKEAALDSALNTLGQQCYTVIVKKKFLSDGTTLELSDVHRESEGDVSLQSDNVGHRLLQMMGWSGGGLGKDGAGISEPITPKAIFGREGLGAATNKKSFKTKIRKMIEDFARGSSIYDLVFAPGFTNEQRKEMHEIARRLGLRSKSFGKNEDRFITVSKRVDPQNILQELLARGGSNEKYELVPPGQCNP